MRVVINEDIIRNALNESVDEFMLEEGMRDAWNAFRNNKWVNGVWNGLRNGVASYMDWATNGQWNKKYNVYPDSAQKSIRSKGFIDYVQDRLKEQKCLMTWFRTHAANVEKILHYKEGPNHSLYGRQNFFNSSVWMGVTGATAYIEQYCTYDNFVDYVKQYFNDFQGNEYIEQYIGKYVQAISDNPLKCLQNLNINKFVSSPEGNKYYKQTQKERNAYYDRKNGTGNTQTSYADKCLDALDTFEDDAKKYFDGAFRATFSQDGINDYFRDAFSKQFAVNNSYIRSTLQLINSYTKNAIHSANGDYDSIDNALKYDVFLNDPYGQKFISSINQLKKLFSQYS